MAVNRFTNLTPSAYKPMTSQEIMMVPLAMREQHNKTQATIQSQLDELDKIRALPVHTPELTERKAALINSINALSSDLANQGFSNDMTNKVIKLNRDIKNELSPQGRLGQINAAYDIFFKYLDEGQKANKDSKWGQLDFNRNWNEHSNNYQGYDEKGNIINISPLDVANKVTITDRFKALSDVMGDAKIASEIIGGGATIIPQADGSAMKVVTKTGEKLSYNNPQVVSLLSAIHNELNDPTSELSKSRVYAGQSLDQALGEAFNIAKSKIDIATSETYQTDKDLYGYRNRNEAAEAAAAANATNVETIPLGAVDYALENVDDIIEKANLIGKPNTKSTIQNSSVMMGAPILNTTNSTSNYTKDDLFKKGTRERAIYDSAEKLSKKLNIPINKALELKAKEFESVVIKPDIVQNKGLFPNSLIGKDNNERSANVKNDILYRGRKLFDPKTGEEYDIHKELGDDVKNVNVEYYGMLSPMNLRGTKLKTKDQNVSPHYVFINGKSYIMDRTSTEMNTPEFKRARRINDVWNSLVTNSDQIVKLPKEWGNLGGLRLRYNSTQPGMVEIYNYKTKKMESTIYNPITKQNEPLTTQKLLDILSDENNH